MHQLKDKDISKNSMPIQNTRKMKHLHYIVGLTLAIVFSVVGNQLSAQTAVGIGSTTFTPDANSVLEIRSATTGVLLPRMATDPVVAGNNDDGLMYFNTSSQTYRYYDETVNTWKSIATLAAGDYILNQTTQQTTANYNIDGAGVIGTTLSVGSTIAAGAGIRVGSAALTPAAGAGNILMTVDDSWIGTGIANTDTRLQFDKTSGVEGVTLFVNKASIPVGGHTALTIKNTGAASAVGLKLSGVRNLAGEPIGFIDFENTDGTTDILGRLGVRNQNALNTQGSFHISLLSTVTSALEERLILTHEGNLTIDGKFNSQGIQETSDARFKKNITGISNALSTVLSLEGVTYNWRTEEFPERAFSERMEFGVIAQQIEKYVPELVSTDEDGYKSVQYSHMVPLLLEAIKEQQDIINSQSKELGVLKASVEAIAEHIKTAEK